MAEHSQPLILVVDDNEQNRALGQATLEDEGYRVSLAKTGEEALKAFASERPDCVLLDVRMPGMDGFEVCSRIRALPEGGRTPVIFLTALRDVETFDHALRVGGDDFLTKPVRPTELIVRVRTALELRRVSAELGDTYELVRRQRDDLMRLQLQKERLTAFVVHDLKNPVNALDLHAQILLRDQALPASARESVEHIRQEARALTRMVMNLLDIGKSEEASLVPRQSDVDLPALAAELLQAFEVKARIGGVTLTSSIEVNTLRVDADLFRRVLENLLDNAVRHAPAGSTVRLLARPADDGTELRVSDGGRGIPAEMLERVFDRYVRVENGGEGSRSGHGLGLAFCKLAVEAHGGRIWVEDAHPGAAFVVRLPRE
jgi:two-component system, sensor histidine kinase and response regulator